MSFWDNHPPEGDFPPLLPAPNTGGWQAGMTIAGTITKERAHKFEGDENVTPILHIQDANGQEWSVGCGAMRLKALMFSLRPPVGAWVQITCLGKEGKSLNFDVQTNATPAQPAAAPAPAPAAPAAAPAAPPAPAYPPQPAAPAAPPAGAYVPPAMPAPAPAQPAGPAPTY
jgi:hypothetical protein